MIIWFLIILLSGGIGWAVAALGAYWLMTGLLDLFYVWAVIGGLLLCLLWRLAGGRTRLERARDGIRAQLRRRGINDPDAWMGLGPNAPATDEHGIPYL